jgi:hypothetical protein
MPSAQPETNDGGSGAEGPWRHARLDHRAIIEIVVGQLLFVQKLESLGA